MSLKLTLISSLVTVGVAGISTGGYFLLRKGERSEGTKQEGTNEKPSLETNEKGSGGEAGGGGVTGVQKESEVPGNGQSPQVQALSG